MASARKVLIIVGHPKPDSFCAALAAAYRAGAEAAGHELRQLDLAALRFDPVLHDGYDTIQPLEPDLQAAQDHIRWADHLVFVYPTWWGSIPALLKGFFDRVFLPGFAFKFRSDSVWWDKLLTGRTADLLVTMDTPPWYFRWVYRAPGHNEMKRTILGFCGIKTRRILSFGPMRSASPARRTAWLAEARRAGGNG